MWPEKPPTFIPPAKFPAIFTSFKPSPGCHDHAPLQVGSEALSMRKAMKSLKQQALEISVRSQKEADAATEVRKTVEDTLKTISAELQVGRLGL